MAEPGQYDDPALVEADRVGVADLLLRLRRKGITDQRLASAIEAVPRRLFVPAGAQAFAYADSALPIECGQTIGAPEIVGRMTSALDVQPFHRVLEIGTGSGYQAAILAGLAKHVYSVERYRTLADAATQRLRTLGIANVTIGHGDGTIGLPGEAPFDRIMVTAAAEAFPPAHRDQLAANGVAIIPIGPADGVQRLMRIVRNADGLTEEAIAEVRFVPLLPGKAAVL